MQLMIEYSLLGRLWLVYLANIYSLFSNRLVRLDVACTLANRIS